MDLIGRVLSDSGEAWERLKNMEKVSVIGDLAVRMTAHLEEHGTPYLVTFYPGTEPRWEYQLPVLQGSYRFQAGEVKAEALEALRSLVYQGRTLVQGSMAEGLTTALEALGIAYLVLYHPVAGAWPEHWEYRLWGYGAPLEF